LRQAPGTTKRSEVAVLRADAEKSLEAAIEAAEQLAIYYEHRVKQPWRAADLIREAINRLREAKRRDGVATTRTIKMESRLVHRLARLERRCSDRTKIELLQAGNSS